MTDDEVMARAMSEAIALARLSEAPRDVNPRVGCVIVSADGAVVGRGFTGPGAGTPHAEVAALADAGDLARGATAVVTLEPCRHVGRTGPCTDALIDAGIARVVYAQADPTEDAGGGAAVLVAAGVAVTGGLLADEAERINLAWTFAARTGRPLVTWKCAVSMDGRVAGPDGGPTSITGPVARAAVHVLRSDVGAIVVGTGTALIDDPELTVRLAAPVAAAPVRVVVGSRSLRPDARILDDQAPTLVMDEHEPGRVLAALFDRGVRHVLLEGGPTLAAGFLRARLVDRVEWYMAPLLLGDGPVALADWVTASGAPLGVDVEDVAIVGEDVRVVGRIRYQEAGL